MITKQVVIKEWMSWGLEDFYLAFVINKWDYQRSFLIAQGLELICKAYLLGKRSGEYTVIDDEEEAIRIIDKIAKHYNHNFEKMLNEIGSPEINELIKNEYDGYNGIKLLENLKLIHTESRYRVPPEPISRNFPAGKTGCYFNPICSSGLQRFAYTLGKKMIELIKRNFSISLDRNEVHGLISKGIDYTKKTKMSESTQMRFCNVFFGDDGFC